VQYRISPSGDVYVEQRSGKRLVGVQMDWTCNFRAGDDGETLATFSFQSNPARHIRYEAHQGADDPILPYTKMAESGFDDFSARLVAQLGIGPEVGLE
ncbi:MAG TPA: hypothetical protein VMT18_14130, partial [Planctomycetota bacterium]|nr:hypothetical protein [Planctomycetota bacterium]